MREMFTKNSVGYGRKTEREHTGAVESDKLPTQRKETEHRQIKG